MGCCRWHSAAASQGIHRFRLAKRSQSDPPMVIGECIGCEYRNSFGSSDPSFSGVARGKNVSGRWPIGGSVARHTILYHASAKGVMTMAALGATGKRRFRPESQTRARPSQHNEAPRATRRPETRTWPPMSAPGLKGRFQQSEVREDLERRAWLRNRTRFEIGPSGLTNQFLGCRRPRAAPWATGNRPFRPESQTDERHKPNTRRNGLQGRRVSWVMLAAPLGYWKTALQA